MSSCVEIIVIMTVTFEMLTVDYSLWYYTLAYDFARLAMNGR